MPIPKEQFERGLSDTKIKVLELLRTRSDWAFNVTDVLDELGIERGSLGRAIVAAFAFSGVLENLVSKDVIRKKEISGATYYMLK